MNFNEIQHTYHYVFDVSWLTWGMVLKMALLIACTRVKVVLNG